MNIYEMSLDEIRIIMKQFSKTVYGRTVFVIAYFVPIVLFLSFVGVMIAALVSANTSMFAFGIGLLLVFVPTFMVAHAYYYRELRAYVEHFRSSEHARVRRYFNK
ncbi:hypothetical protein IJ847_02435 [Candidatus Saccharibacteria bacterium]|nr:hypothetical protein [Candidatus Saccharibacteria bacterium]